MRKLIMSRRAQRASRPMIVGLVVAALALLSAGAVVADPGHWFDGNDSAWPYASADRDAKVLVAVGDISCQPTAPQGGEKAGDVCDGTQRDEQQNATAMETEAMKPNLVAVLGDEQYQNGYYSDFENSYDKYWGAFKFLQRPAPGNHEFYDNHGQPGVRGVGYFDYFNGIRHNAADGSEIDQPAGSGSTVAQPAPQQQGQAGEFGQTGNGWYSYNLGVWHLISLNVECADEPGGCSPTGSWFASETHWLAQDLAANHSQCTLAYWHQPTFSSTATPFTSDSQEGQTADAWWKLLYAHHADVVLNGHDHVYSRFAPMNPAGQADPRHGIREFIVGTGGEALDTLAPSTPNLQASADQYYGVMKMTLRSNGYRWDYQSALESSAAPAGTPASYSDTGSGTCHGAQEN
jgi:acid phosphatase type 7